MFEIAYASTSGAASSGSGMTSILMIVVMLAIFYFLLIRPENKRKKQAEEMRSSLKKGDWITTIGGVYGRVVTITDRTVVIETSEDRVRVEFLKSAIGSVGTLEEQAAAAAAPRRGKKAAAETKDETPAVEGVSYTHLDVYKRQHLSPFHPFQQLCAGSIPCNPRDRPGCKSEICVPVLRWR